MDKIKTNKIALIMCVSFIIFALIFSIIYTKNTYEQEYTQEDYNYLHNYKYNEVVYSYITEKDMAQIYLADFINTIIRDKKDAYELIDEYYKNNKIQTYQKFENYIEEKSSANFYSAKLKSYNIVDKGNYNLFYIIDSANNSYIFKEKSIMNYTVYLDTYTIE